jgi:hypothetical protein
MYLIKRLYYWLFPIDKVKYTLTVIDEYNRMYCEMEADLLRKWEDCLTSPRLYNKTTVIIFFQTQLTYFRIANKGDYSKDIFFVEVMQQFISKYTIFNKIPHW